VRILITTPIFPPDLGGPAVYVPSFANFMVSRGHDVKVVAFCEDPEPKGWPFPVVAITRDALAKRYLKSFVQIFRHAKDRDLVYVNEHLALLAVLAARLRGKKAVVRVMVDGSWEISHRYGWTNDDIDTFQTRSYGFKVWLTRTLQRWWWRKVDAIVAPSDYLRRIVIGHRIEPDKVHLIHNVYNGPKAFAATKDEARAALRIPPERKVVLTVCRLMVWKGVDAIIEALVGLPDDVHLHVVGDGDQLEPWKRHAELHGVGDRVHFEGNRPHAETLQWIRAADVFVLNSRYEGLSHTLLEVMFLGTPIVCSDVCGNPELVEHDVNGLLVRFNEVAAIAAGIERLLADRSTAELFGRRSQDKVRRFDREHLFGKVEALFTRLLANGAAK
jgi:glycosyltransferase involved in cell wall biosynthesis